MANEITARSDYQVCCQCRLRKIRCDRERPQCSNCVRFGFDCEWSGSGKKKNQTVVLIKTINELRTRLDHLVDSVSKIEKSLHNLRSQIPTPPPSMHQLPPTPPNGLSLTSHDFANKAHTPPPSSHGVYSSNFNAFENSMSSHGGPLPPHISSALQMLATYNADTKDQSRNPNASPGTRLTRQQHFLQTVQHLSTTEAGSTALAALFNQPDNLAAVSSFANAMFTSGTSTPHSVPEEQSTYSYGNSAPHSFAPVATPYVQPTYAAGMPASQPSDHPFLARMPLHPTHDSPNDSTNSEDFMAQHHAFFNGMQDPSSVAAYRNQHTPAEEIDFSDLHIVGFPEGQ